MQDDDVDDKPWRPAASGASFVYVFPRPGEDLLKLGMSRDPLARLQSLHPRWYDFFDLDAGWILATDRVREARALELQLARSLEGHGAPAPLTVRTGAGGDTEWYRGAARQLEDLGQALAMQGHPLHRPLRPWLASQLQSQGSHLFHWSESLLGLIESSGPRPPASPHPLEWTLCHGLDAWPALGLDVAAAVSPRVHAWRAAFAATHGS